MLNQLFVLGSASRSSRCLQSSIMINTLQDSLLDEAVHRAEQSRHSYNVQTEEFVISMPICRVISMKSKRSTRKTDAFKKASKRFERRTSPPWNIISFVCRITFDSRVRRWLKLMSNVTNRNPALVDWRPNEKNWNDAFISWREMKKTQHKQLTVLHKQERLVQNEFRQLSSHIESLLRSVENEKQLHRQAMSQSRSFATATGASLRGTIENGSNGIGCFLSFTSDLSMIF